MTHNPDPIDVAPAPAALLQSLRGLGYTPEAALADLVDNSLAAGARRVWISLNRNNGDAVIQVLDDGAGIARERLPDVLRFGGEGPAAERGPDDLGRFGLGLKTASLSQARRLTVASRTQNGAPHALQLDVDRIVAARKWLADRPELTSFGPLASTFDRLVHGTLVSWTKPDPQAALWELDRAGFNARVADIREHLAMTFHRFLDGERRRLRIEVNGRALDPWDPFCRHHPATTVLPADRIRLPSGAVDVRPYVLPHRDRFGSEAEHDAAGGPGGWPERQGFYVYRGGRLVVAGSWLGLGGARRWSKDESSRLARILVDLPTRADAEWRIDVRKATAQAPAAATGRLTTVAEACRRRAREVFVWRGAPAPGPRSGGRGATLAPLWEARSGAAAPRYVLRRDHPSIRAVAAAVSDPRAFEGLLRLTELTVPVERIWLDVSESAPSPQPLTAEDRLALVASLAALVRLSDSVHNWADRVRELLRGMRLDDPSLAQDVLERLDAYDSH